MEFYLREGRAEDAEAMGCVHYTSWKETYEGLIPKEFYDNLKLENYIKRARQYYRNAILAVVDNQIVGFVMYLEDANDISSIKPASEITALYVLKQYQKKGIGHALMQEAYKRVTKNKIVLFVLESNEQAIRFYKNLGFVFTGHKIIQPVPGGELVEVEMVLER